MKRIKILFLTALLALPAAGLANGKKTADDTQQTTEQEANEDTAVKTPKIKLPADDFKSTVNGIWDH